MSYIDTQGMTLPDPYDEGEVYKGSPESYPEFNVNKTKLFSDLAKKELKAMINEVLDERERRYYNTSDEELYRGTY